MPASLKKRKLMGEINVVPYIDVMLVLLIIFMVTAPLLTQGIEVELPKANAEPIEAVPDHDPLVVSVDADGQLYLNAGDDSSASCWARSRKRRCSSRPTVPSLTETSWAPWSCCSRPARAISAS